MCSRVNLGVEVILVMEYLDGGELFERVADDDFNLTESDCCLFMRQICRYCGLHLSAV